MQSALVWGESYLRSNHLPSHLSCFNPLSSLHPQQAWPLISHWGRACSCPKSPSNLSTQETLYSLRVNETGNTLTLSKATLTGPLACCPLAAHQGSSCPQALRGLGPGRGLPCSGLAGRAVPVVSPGLPWLWAKHLQLGGRGRGNSCQADACCSP